MNFTTHYFTEVEDTPRVGIKHIYGGESGQYSMKPEDFIDLINYIKQSNQSILSKVNTHLSEKVDGFSLKFGLDEHNKFFIESSHSGLVYDEGKFRQFTIDKKGQTDQISEGYEDIFKKLKQNKELQNYLKSINTPSGVKVQTETFYLPIGKTSETDSSLVKFVATWYKKEMLGSWATFVVINVTDGKGRPMMREEVQKIKEDLKQLSTKEIKFDYGDIPEFKDVDLSKEIHKVEQFINTVEKEFGEKIDDIVKNPSRKRSDLEKKRKIKEEMLKFQKEFSNKISSLIRIGKFGDQYEGLVLQLSNGIIFKVVSDRFKEAKKEYNKEYKRD